MMLTNLQAYGKMQLTLSSGRKIYESVHGTPSNGVIC